MGLADTADSLAAIKKLVFEDNELSLEDIVKAMDANFEGYEEIRSMLIKDAPKYGNNIDYVDDIARRVQVMFCEEVNSYENPRRRQI